MEWIRILVTVLKFCLKAIRYVMFLDYLWWYFTQTVMIEDDDINNQQHGSQDVPPTASRAERAADVAYDAQKDRPAKELSSAIEVLLKDTRPTANSRSSSTDRSMSDSFGNRRKSSSVSSDPDSETLPGRLLKSTTTEKLIAALGEVGSSLHGANTDITGPVDEASGVASDKRFEVHERLQANTNNNSTNSKINARPKRPDSLLSMKYKTHAVPEKVQRVPTQKETRVEKQRDSEKSSMKGERLTTTRAVVNYSTASTADSLNDVRRRLQDIKNGRSGSSFAGMQYGVKPAASQDVRDYLRSRGIILQSKINDKLQVVSSDDESVAPQNADDAMAKVLRRHKMPAKTRGRLTPIQSVGDEEQEEADSLSRNATNKPSTVTKSSSQLQERKGSKHVRFTKELPKKDSQDHESDSTKDSDPAGTINEIILEMARLEELKKKYSLIANNSAMPRSVSTDFGTEQYNKKYDGTFTELPLTHKCDIDIDAGKDLSVQSELKLQYEHCSLPDILSDTQSIDQQPETIGEKDKSTSDNNEHDSTEVSTSCSHMDEPTNDKPQTTLELSDNAQCSDTLSSNDMNVTVSEQIVNELAENDLAESTENIGEGSLQVEADASDKVLDLKDKTLDPERAFEEKAASNDANKNGSTKENTPLPGDQICTAELTPEQTEEHAIADELLITDSEKLLNVEKLEPVSGDSESDYDCSDDDANNTERKLRRITKRRPVRSARIRRSFESSTGHLIASGSTKTCTHKAGADDTMPSSLVATCSNVARRRRPHTPSRLYTEQRKRTRKNRKL